MSTFPSTARFMNDFNYIATADDILTSDLNFGGELWCSEAYSLEEFEDTIYIVGKSEKGDWPKFKKPKRNEGWVIKPHAYSKLLTATIALVNKPEPWNWDTFTFCDLEWQNSFNDTIPFKKVGQWLTDYGLPSADKCLYENRGIRGYSLQQFKLHIATLFLMYEMYSLMTEKGNFKKYGSILLNHPWLTLNHGRPVDPDRRNEFNNNFTNSPPDKARRLARYLMSIFINSSIKDITLNYSFLTPKFYWQAHSLFDICYYQLAVLSTLSLDSYDEYKRHIKECKYCHTQFWGHGNKQYCDHCDRRTVWKRNQKK